MLKKIGIALSFIGFCHAAEEDYAKEIEQIEWNCQVENVKAYLQFQEVRILVMGVDTQESDLGFEIKSMSRFSTQHVFLDRNSKPGHLRNRDLKVDFNDLDQLKRLATDFADYFDSIILDDSTFKSTNWMPDHLACFKAMLKIKGTFIFGPGYGMIGYDQCDEFRDSDDAKRRELIRSITEDYLVSEATRTTGLKTDRLCTYIGIPFAYGHVVDERTGWAKQHTDKARDFAMSFLYAYVLPENYVRIMSRVFGEANVAVELDKPLPFPSRYNKERQNILLTATRQ